MAIRKLDKSEWAPFFDRLSDNISGEEVEVEVVSLQAGDQIATNWVRLSGLTYDPKDDALDVFTESLDHRIPAPSWSEVVHPPPYALAGLNRSA